MSQFDDDGHDNVTAAPVISHVSPIEAAGRTGQAGTPRRPRRARRWPVPLAGSALAAALGISGVVWLGPESAQADATAQTEDSVAVAAALGIDGATAPVDVDAARLAELASSRSEREAEQQAAAQTQENADSAAAAALVEAARPKTVLPIQGARVSSGFGTRWGVLHAGVDFAAPMDTPEYAAADGVVLEAGPASGFGLAVYIQHANGDVTVYGHMDQILVTAGQVVRAGDTIALLGNRGQSTGPHLHFEVRIGGLGGTPVDPIPWLRERGVLI